MERYAAVHYFLECPRAHLIPIPRPSQSETDSNPPATAKDVARVFVACPECGLVSDYSALDVRKYAAGTPDPFEAGLCHFVVLTVECGEKDCETPAVVHTTIGGDRGNWKEKVRPIDWKFSPTCICESGHRLAPSWEDNRFAWKRIRSPF